MSARARAKALKQLIGLILLSLLIGLSVPHAARAHENRLIKSSPNPDETLQNSPNEIVLQFSEEVDSKDSYLELVDAAGTVVAKGGVDLNDVDHATLRVAVPRVLGKGIYTVRYRMLLLDGDTTANQFNFGVGIAVPQNFVSANALQQVVSNQQPAPLTTSIWIVPVLTVLVMVIFVLSVLMLRRRVTRA